MNNTTVNTSEVVSNEITMTKDELQSIINKAMAASMNNNKGEVKMENNNNNIVVGFNIDEMINVAMGVVSKGSDLIIATAKVAGRIGKEVGVEASYTGIEVAKVLTVNSISTAAVALTNVADGINSIITETKDMEEVDEMIVASKELYAAGAGAVTIITDYVSVLFTSFTAESEESTPRVIRSRRVK